ncbi:hypothetical protein ACIB24_01490 [Spongisporangium articulatum]|uniref:Uncharacterized protein n=1 Tax=Spongisporangium articulatum TaxID=3362603 RepID=A0ABW8AID2_9ACTN
MDAVGWLIALVVVTVVVVVCPLGPGGWQRAPTGWRGVVLRPVIRLLGLVTRPVRALRRRLHPPPPPDPFEALRVQTRLGAVAEEIRVLHVDEAVYARAARLEARSAAYDALLLEACALAGIPEQADGGRRADVRLRREVELAERGWSW